MIRPLAALLAPFALLALLPACGPKPEDGPIAVSVVGPPPAIVDPSRRPLSAPAAVLLSATAQGLVRFDALGQIEPGLAIRWDVSDDGLYYTFRLADGLGLDANGVARRLRAAIAPASRNPLKPLLGAIDEIVAVTPEVIEIRLVAPEPRLLELLAQPELALIDGGAGTGPYAVAVREGHVLVLNPPTRPDDDEPPVEERRRREIRLRGDRAAMAVARFREGGAGLVLGGDFAQFPVARIARLPVHVLRFDPVSGLFGLEIVEPRDFLANADNRRALAMAIDRDRIAAAFSTPAWRNAEGLVPGGTELRAPAWPGWAELSPQARRQLAADSVRAWTARQKQRPILRVAMPDGPGGRLLFDLIAIDWRAIGVDAERVPLSARADLRLIDAVAPSDTAAWYLRRYTCLTGPICSEQADRLLDAARTAKTADERAARLADADARLVDVAPFIAIAQPLRWSLVSPGLDSFQENVRGVHPLPHLRGEGR